MLKWLSNIFRKKEVVKQLTTDDEIKKAIDLLNDKEKGAEKKLGELIGTYGDALLDTIEQALNKKDVTKELSDRGFWFVICNLYPFADADLNKKLNSTLIEKIKNMEETQKNNELESLFGSKHSTDFKLNISKLLDDSDFVETLTDKQIDIILGQELKISSKAFLKKVTSDKFLSDAFDQKSSQERTNNEEHQKQVANILRFCSHDQNAIVTLFSNDNFWTEFKSLYGVNDDSLRESFKKVITNLHRPEYIKTIFNAENEKDFKCLITLLKNDFFASAGILGYQEIKNILENCPDDKMSELFQTKGFVDLVKKNAYKPFYFDSNPIPANEDREIEARIESIRNQQRINDIYLPVYQDGKWLLCFIDDKKKLQKKPIKKIVSKDVYKDYYAKWSHPNHLKAKTIEKREYEFKDYIEKYHRIPLPSTIVKKILSNEDLDSTLKEDFFADSDGENWKQLVLEYFKKGVIDIKHVRQKTIREEFLGKHDLSYLWRDWWCWLLNGARVFGALLNTVFLVIIHPAMFPTSRDLMDLENTIDLLFLNEQGNLSFNRKDYFYKSISFTRNNFLGLGTVELEGVTISKKNPGHDLKDELHIYYKVGNCQSVANSEVEENAIRDINEGEKLGLKVTAHLINSRGIGTNDPLAKGYYSEQIINDDIAIVKKSIDQTVRKDKSFKWVIDGYSLGAGLAAKMVYKLHQQGYMVQLIHGRSFSTFARARTLYGNKDVGHNLHEKQKKTSPNWFRHYILTPLGDLLLALIGWKLNALWYYNHISEEYKTYLKAQKDKQISNYGSLHYGLKPKRRLFKKAVEKFKSLIEEKSNEDKKIEDLFELVEPKSEKSWTKADAAYFKGKFQEEIWKLYAIYNPDKKNNFTEQTKITKSSTKEILAGLSHLKYCMTTGRKFESSSDGDSHMVSLDELRQCKSKLEGDKTKKLTAFKFKWQEIKRRYDYHNNEAGESKCNP